jgi:uncharacterized membrane protein YdjX (TVP38/TMEM64 family)
MRSGLTVISVLSLVLASCATAPTAEEANDAVLVLRNYGSWAWALGIALIWADLVLPIPQTAVIAALGIIYGTLLGGLLGSLGLITGGLLGYGLMLTSARRFAQRFAGPRSLRKMESLFDRGGAWAIVLTCSLPYSVAEALRPSPASVKAGSRSAPRLSEPITTSVAQGMENEKVAPGPSFGSAQMRPR